MDWLEITLNTRHDEIDTLCERLESLGVNGVVINDEADVTDFLEKGKKYWDYVDEEVIDRVRGVCSLQFYLEDSENGLAELDRIRTALGGPELGVRHVRDEDWENNWREYYKPIETGEKLVIIPEWEKAPECGIRVPLRLDPGLIFGTGSHATTRMCLEELERYRARAVLDLGCGSGILAIASLLLGAEKAYGCDIDEKAPDVVRSNGELNSLYPDRLAVYAGDILSDERLRTELSKRSYDLILANIVADVIIQLAPFAADRLAPDGVFICSGIIEGRQAEVLSALRKCGLEIISSRSLRDWYCFTARLRR